VVTRISNENALPLLRSRKIVPSRSYPACPSQRERALQRLASPRALRRVRLIEYEISFKLRPI
jgi:hypothetical protein